ncbi:MAG: ferrous iron transport protein A [Kiritimatiellae bacterium]|nr:ferrous iron transport protein A [Kiritimatiellia bacterium]
MNPALLMPLGAVPAGRSVVLRRVQGGRGLTSHLAAMRLLPGVRAQVCRNDRTGPVLLGVNGSRMMLGRGMAEKVWVQEVGQDA